MTHTADHNHTTNPRNTNNPSALQSSTITKPTTQNTRITDQIGEHRTKSEPVHTHAGPCPAANHGIIAEARNHRDLITPSQSTAGVPDTQNTRTTDRTGEHRPKTDPVRACADHGITPATRPTPQTRGIPMICRRRGNRTPDHRARYRPSPWTESGIARRNQDQSTPAPTMTHHADRNHTTKPRNTNNPNTPPSSTIAKRTTQNTRTKDQTGKRKPKTDPVHTRTDHDTHPGHTANPQNLNNQPAARAPNNDD